MKKILALLLAAVMCLSLCACSGESDNKAIAGEWKAVSCDASAVFHEDGSGALSGTFIPGCNFTWKYDKDLKCYVIAAAQTMNATINTINEIEYISLYGGIQFFRVENYDQAIQIVVNNREDEIANLIDGKTKLELGVAYDLGNDLSVVYNVIPVNEGERFDLILETAVSNNGTSEIQYMSSLPASYTAKYYLYDAPNGTTSNGGMGWSGQSNARAGETVVISNSLITKNAADVEKALDVFGKVIGAFCFEMNGTEYYIDLSDYIKK